ncbi:hypothetical protein DV737_g3273, partial [Chaetothyriales sp. CBS 132003]
MLTKVRRMLRKPKAGFPEFDLRSAEHFNEILRLLYASKAPQLSVHFEILGDEPQILHLSGIADRYKRSDVGQDAPQKQKAPSDAAPSQVSPPLCQDGAKLYAIGSYTKIFINLAFVLAVKDQKYKELGLSWQKSACDLFNELREANGKSTIKRLHGNPTVRQLLLHENGFAPMNRLLLAPDGQFIMTDEEFIVDGHRVTDDHYKEKYPHRGWVEYSNGNHIFAAMILEELTKLKLSQALDVLVFRKLNFKSTILDQDSLVKYAAQSSTREPLVRGSQISSEGKLRRLQSPRYLADSIEVASFGTWSSLEDLATLNRELLLGAQGFETAKLSYSEVEDFLTPGPLCVGETSTTLCGLFSDIHSEHLGLESPNRMLLLTDPRKFMVI